MSTFLEVQMYKKSRLDGLDLTDTTLFPLYAQTVRNHSYPRDDGYI